MAGRALSSASRKPDMLSVRVWFFFVSRSLHSKVQLLSPRLLTLMTLFHGLVVGVRYSRLVLVTSPTANSLFCVLLPESWCDAFHNWRFHIAVWTNPILLSVSRYDLDFLAS